MISTPEKTPNPSQVAEALLSVAIDGMRGELKTLSEARRTITEALRDSIVSVVPLHKTDLLLALEFVALAEKWNWVQRLAQDLSESPAKGIAFLQAVTPILQASSEALRRMAEGTITRRDPSEDELYPMFKYFDGKAGSGDNGDGQEEQDQSKGSDNPGQ